MLKRRSLILVATFAFVLLILQMSARAVAAAPGPEDVARAALKSIKEDRIEDFARAMHPESLIQLKTTLVTILDGAAKAGLENEILPLFAGAKTVNDVKALDEVSFMAAYLRAMSQQIPGLKETLKKMDMQVVGHINEGKEKVYVVYRSQQRGDEAGATAMKVIGLRKNGPGWGMILGDDIEVILLMLKQKVEGKGAMPNFNLAASQVELLGQVLEGRDKAHHVFRLTTPVNDSKVSKVSVLSVSKTDPEWAVMQSGAKAEIKSLIEQSVGIKKPPQPALRKAAPAATRPSSNRP